MMPNSTTKPEAQLYPCIFTWYSKARFAHVCTVYCFVHCIKYVYAF